MKKFIGKTAAVAISACIIFGSAATLSACSGNYSETFTGAVSEQTYDSVEDAVQGYLDTEISGISTTAVLVEYTSEGTLSEKEISELTIDEEYTEGLLSVEKLSVEYSETPSSALTAASVNLTATETATTYKKTVYVLSYTAMFRFFVPAMKTGETLTASYFDSTFDGTKYVNCSMTATIKGSYSDGDYAYTLSNEANVKITEDALYEYDDATMKMNEETQSGTMEFYLVNGGERLKAFYKYDDKDFTSIESSFSTVRGYFLNWFDERFGQLDHTFFEKTDTGYALRADRYNQYLSAMNYRFNGEFDLEYTINISDGRMADVTLAIAYEGFSCKMSIKFFDFGKTVIELPESVTAQLNK